MANAGETEWVLISLDDTMAKRQGLPPQIPIPKEEFEGLAEKGLGIDRAREWIKSFLDNSEPGKNGHWRKENSNLIARWDAFQDKVPLWGRAQEAFAANDFEKAIKTLKRITIMDDFDHAAKLNLASAYANTGEHDKALKAFKQVKETFDGDADFHMALGQLYLAKQDRDGAINEFVNALDAQPDTQPALDALAKLGVLVAIYEDPRDAASLTYVRSDSVTEYLTGEWDKETRTTEYYLEQLNYHERENRHALALEAAKRASAAASEPVERAELGVVAALRAMGKNDEALQAAKAYKEKAPKSAGACVELARCHRALSASEAARAAIDEALNLDPGDQAALVLRFWPEDTSDLHTVNATIPELEKFAESHAEHAGCWRSLARAMLTIGRTEEALDLFKRAVGLAPIDDDLRAEWWGELGKQQRFQEIVSDAEGLEGLKSRDWKLRWNEAEAYLGLDKKMEARSLFSAINFDETLHVDIRRRAKRAVTAMDENKTFDAVADAAAHVAELKAAEGGAEEPATPDPEGIERGGEKEG